MSFYQDLSNGRKIKELVPETSAHPTPEAHVPSMDPPTLISLFLTSPALNNCAVDIQSTRDAFTLCKPSPLNPIDMRTDPETSRNDDPHNVIMTSDSN